MATTTHRQKRPAKNDEEGDRTGVTREWISLKDVQTILGFGSTKAYELAASGSIPGVIKVGRIIRINEREFRRWLREQSTSG